MQVQIPRERVKENGETQEQTKYMQRKMCHAALRETWEQSSSNRTDLTDLCFEIINLWVSKTNNWSPTSNGLFRSGARSVRLSECFGSKWRENRTKFIAVSHSNAIYRLILCDLQINKEEKKRIEIKVEVRVIYQIKKNRI